VANGDAPALVELQQLLRLRRQVAPLQPAIEISGMLADPSDIVHGKVFSASWPDLFRPSR
jgi:hypothetical protein